ncbi:MAG: glycosyltransferase family 4 protein [Pseudomonadota bacterium]
MTVSNDAPETPYCPRIAVVVSHPIQHFCPQYTSLATSDLWELKVFFGSPLGLEAYHDRNFGREVRWGGLDLSGFEHEFLHDAPIASGPKLDAPHLGERLADYDPHVVISYGYAQKLQRRAQDWAKQNNKLLYYISDAEEAHRPSPLKIQLKRVLLRQRMARIDRFLSVGDFNELVHRGFGAAMDRITRMHFSIDEPRYRAAMDGRTALRAKTRTAFGFEAQDVVVGTVGKLVPWKRQIDVIRAVGQSAPQRQIKALIIGSGPDMDAAKAVAEQDAPGRVVFSGFVDPVELPALYAASDIYAHAAAFEPHSLAISEAAYMGLPLVLSDRCGSYGPNDDLRVGANGWTYPMGDLQTLIAHLERLAADPALCATFGAASHAYAVNAQARAHGHFLTEALIADGFSIPSNAR